MHGVQTKLAGNGQHIGRKNRRSGGIVIGQCRIIGLDDTVTILSGIKNYYEQYHGIVISDEIVKKTVVMSERYITDRYLPDKAIDLLDEDGILNIAIYPGHKEGDEEGKLVCEYLSSLSRFKVCVTRVQIINSPTSPYFLMVETKP